MRPFLITTALLLATTTTWAQTTAKSVVTLTAVSQPANVARGGHGVLSITLHVSPGYHINSAKPTEKTLIATTFVGAAPAGVKFGAAQFGPAKSFEIPAANPLSVYMGTTTVRVPFTVAKKAKPGRLTLGGSVNYQACNATACFPPSSTPVHASLSVK